MLCKLKDHFGKKVNNFVDLGVAVYGENGGFTVGVIIILSQLMVCMSYVLFFVEQLDLILYQSTDGGWGTGN
jgi:amino acid permease